MSPAPFVWPVRVYWEDTDAGGIVFYANYLKFMERARTEWLRHLGVSQQTLREREGGFFVVQHTELRYLRPARLDDALLVSADITAMGRASVVMQQSVCRADDASCLCEGRIRIGWVDALTLKPGRMPDTLIQSLQQP